MLQARHRVFAISALIILMGCGLGNSPSRARAAIDTNLTLHKGYTIFASHDEASNWYGTYRTTLSLARGGKDPGDVVAFDDGRYLVLKEMVSRLWASFQRLEPELAADVPEPLVLVLNNAEGNAFATYDLRKRIHPHVFFVFTGLIQGNLANKHEVLGVLAHELAHHVLRHAEPGKSQKIEKFYLASAPEPLGALQTNEPRLKNLVASWIEAAELVGPYTLPELRGVPFPSIGYPDLYTLAKTLASSHSEREECRNWNMSANNAIYLIGEHVDRSTQELTEFSKQDLAILDKARQEYNRHLPGCLAGETGSILELVTKLTGRSEADTFRDSHFTEVEKDIMRRQGNTAAALMELADQASARKARLSTQVNLEKVRRYSTEEQADDAAVEALLAIGESADPLVSFFKSTLPKENLNSCLQTIDGGQVPNYGNLSDDHHSTCYRIFHTKEVENYLARNNLEKLPRK